MISLAAINVNKKGASCVGAISELAVAQKVDVMALSEVDVLPSAGPGYLNQWKQLGWHACLSEVEPRGSRVALVSAVPFRPISLCKGEGRARCAAGLFDIQGHDGEKETILIVSVYCQSGDEVASSLQAEDILQSSFSARLRYFALGDWNSEQTQNSIGQLIANGIARAADDCADGCVLPCTGPGRRRRIDYGVCHWQLPATSVQHYSCYVSDHLVVQYQCDLQAPRCRTGPGRSPVGEVSDERLDLYFATWNEQPFHEALCHCDVDTAWAFLCNHAESTLCDTVADNAIPRSVQWQPSAPKPFQRPGKGQVGSEVVCLLRNLLNKLQVLRHRPWDLQLAQRVLRSLPKLRTLGAVLPVMSSLYLSRSAPNSSSLSNRSKRHSKRNGVAGSKLTRPRSDPSSKTGPSCNWNGRKLTRRLMLLWVVCTLHMPLLLSRKHGEPSGLVRNALAIMLFWRLSWIMFRVLRHLIVILNSKHVNFALR